jgi:hypothetical protein
MKKKITETLINPDNLLSFTAFEVLETVTLAIEGSVAIVSGAACLRERKHPN